MGGKGGIVRDAKAKAWAVAEVKAFIDATPGWKVIAETLPDCGRQRQRGSADRRQPWGLRSGSSGSAPQATARRRARRPALRALHASGELVTVEAKAGDGHAEPFAILKPSPERVAPVCQHFGSCGGCALQHMEAHAYLAWKRELVIAALASRGLEAPVEQVRAVPLVSRRRAAFALGRTVKGIAFGCRAARSHAIVDIAACPVLSPAIAGSLPKLKSALAPLLGGKREARITVTEAEQGLDVVVEGIRPAPAVRRTGDGRGEAGAARITLDGESLALRGTPTVVLSGVEVSLPPGTFLQASRESEAVLARL